MSLCEADKDICAQVVAMYRNDSKFASIAINGLNNEVLLCVLMDYLSFAWACCA